MEQRIKERYHPGILQEAMRRYGIADSQIHLLGEVESFVYEYGRGGEAFILRIAHSLRRSAELIHGEVDWINHLARGGVPAARAVLSLGGELVEAIDDGLGGQFLATAFVKARGRPAWETPWTPAFYVAYGRLLGSMHALALDYQPADPAWRRPEWDAPLMEFVERYLPPTETLILQKYHEVVAHLRSLPRGREAYGLIHFDAHPSNLFIDGEDRLTLFDFDECSYSWFANDIAIALFYSITDAEDIPAFTAEFMSHLLAGYRQVRPLERRWLKEIPVFLKLREIEMYAVVHRDFDPQHIDDEYAAWFMRGRKERIEQGLPYIDFDFGDFNQQG
jgi:Ser/Thr protein kinase RdoA (MazF antagonist)